MVPHFQIIQVSRDVEEMRYAFSRVRFRAGLPDLDDDVYTDKNAFYKALKRERQIELFCESARYFDLRRWKDAAVEEDKALWRYKVDATVADRQDFYKREPLWVKKKFEDKMYLWPLPAMKRTRIVSWCRTRGGRRSC